MWKILNCSLHENIELCNVIISRFQNQLTLVNFTNVAALCQGKSRSREIFGGRWPPNTHYFLLSSLLSFSSSIMIYLYYPNDHDKVMRYVNLSTLLVYRLVSGKVLAYLCIFSLKYFQNTRLYFQQQKTVYLEKYYYIMTNCLQVKMRFPTMDSLVEAKLLLPHEADRLEKVDFRLNEKMM